MKLTREILNHFSCDQCRYWWSVASVKFELGNRLYCPTCGHQNTITRIDESGNVEFEAVQGVRNENLLFRYHAKDDTGSDRNLTLP